MKNSAEEKRIREIDEIACLFDADTVQAAKYGPNACTAQELAYRAAQQAAQQGKTYTNADSPDALRARAKTVTRLLFHKD